MIEPLSDAVVVACKKAVQTPPYLAVVETFMSISPTVSRICAVADQPLCVCMELVLVRIDEYLADQPLCMCMELVLVRIDEYFL